MSGKFSKRDGFIFPHFKINKDEFDIICDSFEMAVDYDIAAHRLDLLKIKMLKRQCFIKTLVLPVELPLSYLLLGRLVGRERWNTQKLYWKFLIKSMTIEDFENELNLIIANSNIGR